ncbi:DUF6932 family protein [Methanoculleus sp. 7T]|jgi:hypothetical protein|uniref:DUF6932 family protein n=1 Tax=Methanoculleus sp. 7T TaxID=2937282 RepID=UPI0020BD6CFD|nr:hypothetical protein [Methanoculleus sp. 7T]MCK8519068.1 hypothetical protein [Methanoculleus sp. 7T]
MISYDDAIPNLNTDGVLPPFDESNPTSFYRSPYSVLLPDLVLRFGNTPRRQEILRGYLRFRLALHDAGLVRGFQWVDGSFLENIEEIENREPKDIDVVTFYYLPDGQTQESLAGSSPRLFNKRLNKEDYHVDAYYIQLNETKPETLVGQSAYWYSVWSHRRSGLWKGFLQVDLSTHDDQVALTNLDCVALGGDHS